MSPEEIRANRTKLEKPEFDRLVRETKIVDPKMESFGDGQGEPYNPRRLIFGLLDGKLVWTETA